jgi:hypothetical protein
VGFDVRPPVTWPLSGDGVGVPRRHDVAASAVFAPVGPWSVAGGDASRASGLRARCWSAAAPAPHSNGTGQANSSGWPCRGDGQTSLRPGGSQAAAVPCRDSPVVASRRPQHCWSAWQRVLRCRRCHGARRRLGVIPGRARQRGITPPGDLATSGRDAVHSAWPTSRGSSRRRWRAARRSPCPPDERGAGL